MAKNLYGLILLNWILLGEPIHAITGITNCLQSGLIKNIDLVHKAALIGSENRSVLDPQDARARFGATGLMSCPTGQNTVQVVRAQSGSLKVITSAHQFFSDDCNFLGTAGCTIEFKYSQSSTKYSIKSRSFQKGGHCPSRGDHRVDWAVFELNESMVGITPYAIPAESDPALGPGSQVLTVAAKSHNFVVNGDRPYHFEVCKFNHRFRFPLIPLQSDCDTGGGASGAGQFIDKEGRLTVVAINVAETELPPGWNPNGPKPEYNRDNYFNISVPLEGDFLAAINGTLKR